MNVFLAWTGSYSDSRVIGVYTDEAKAKRVAAACDPRDHHVSSFEVDAGPTPPDEDGLTLWWCISTGRDGLVVEDCWRGTSWLGAAGAPKIGAVLSAYEDGKAPWIVHVYARDEAHATKIAADKFREFVAMHPKT